jgi:homocysteine S-methyltransferase
MEYIKNMNKEVFKNNPMHLGGALNYQGVNVDAIVGRMNKKIEQGCEYFLTQPIFSDEDIERIRLLKSRVDCKIICGIMPLVSYRNALYMHNEMPGVNVPDYVVDSFRADMSREEAEAVSRKISVEIADKLYDVADGYYFMTPFWRVQLIGSIIDEIRSKHS